jgi:hypothetical protein
LRSLDIIIPPISFCFSQSAEIIPELYLHKPFDTTQAYQSPVFDSQFPANPLQALPSGIHFERPSHMQTVYRLPTVKA